MSDLEWQTKPDIRAECLTCGASWHTANAQGVAAKHARKYNHTTRVEIERVMIYDHDPNSEYQAIRKRQTT